MSTSRSDTPILLPVHQPVRDSLVEKGLIPAAPARASEEPDDDHWDAQPGYSQEIADSDKGGYWSVNDGYVERD